MCTLPVVTLDFALHYILSDIACDVTSGVLVASLCSKSTMFLPRCIIDAAVLALQLYR